MLRSTMNRLCTPTREIREEAKPYPDYSGRGMFGAKTCAVVVHKPLRVTYLAAEAVCDMIEKNVDGEEIREFVEDLRNLRFDNYAEDWIVY